MTTGLAQELEEIERDLTVLVARFMRLQDAVANEAKRAQPLAAVPTQRPRAQPEPLVGYQ